MSTTDIADRVANRLRRGLVAAKREAVHQGANAMAADGPGDYVRGQLDEARQLSRKDDEPSGRLATFGQNVDLVGLAIALVVVGVVMYVGLNVMSTTESSTELANDSEFSNASTDLTGGIADAYSLSGILFLVLILTGVVGLLLGLRGRR